MSERTHRGRSMTAIGAAVALSATLLVGGATVAQDDINGATLDIISLDGEDGQNELEAWRAERDITLAKVPFASWDETFAKLKTDVFDIALVANPYVTLWGEAGVLTPLDLSKLPNWENVYPAFREGDFIRGTDGSVYAVPIAWGDGPFIYHPERVAEVPTTILELTDPAWNGRLVTWDDPILLFHTIGTELGYDSPNMTLDELAQVKTEAAKIVDNLVAFNAGYEDAKDLLVRGEADLAIGGWEAMVQWAADDGETLDFAFFDGFAGGWADSLAIPANAEDVDAAYAYINEMISPETNALIASNLLSGATNSQATPMVDPAALMYDYSIVEDAENPIQFEIFNPPLEADEGIATKTDWDEAWAEIRGL